MQSRLLQELFVVIMFVLCATGAVAVELDWQELPPLPNPEGVAGPFVGAYGDTLLVAGGANFPGEPLWETDKVWHDTIYVLQKNGSDLEWKEGGKLSAPMAYGAAVSLPDGVLCMGGNNSSEIFDDTFLMQWDSQKQQVIRLDFPDLPEPCVYGSAVLLDNVVYLTGGQREVGLESATNNFWALDLSKRNTDAFGWEVLEPIPGPPRAFHIAAAQHDGFNNALHVISGRCQGEDGPVFLRDTWRYVPSQKMWRACADLPRAMAGGTGMGWGQSHIFVLGGDDGENFLKTEELKDNHPGFKREAFAYHTITDTWVSVGETPMNQVCTVPVKWDNGIVIASGEVRPRVRTPNLWLVHPKGRTVTFGMMNYAVLVFYLGAMVAMGVYFSNKNADTDEYFRGGRNVVWWAAGCSIFATMLSSLTFMGIPAKAFAQDWVYMVGNFMIVGVAPIAIYLALPFFRSIDVTSAYEYLEKRFSRNVRYFGSASFCCFHLFRMAVVMTLTALALAAITSMTPVQSVLIMGLLSVVYSMMGGVKAVIWTDTVQTFVLLGGGLLVFILLVADSGAYDFVATAAAYDKFRIANFDFTSGSFTRMAIWVVVLGSFGQNISSYTADQAVVQRYMTTETESLARRSIWTNAVMSMIATFLFFGIGTALFVYYRSHPERLDPNMSTDQIFPLYIASQLPRGFAGLLVAGIFAAAQSTVSTSINSIATTSVTDFLRPWNACKTETGYLRCAQGLSLVSGVLGTFFGLFFINPEIRSLLDTFFMVIGLFMGVLGGLFVLGMLTRRANAIGAIFGALIGVVVMFTLWKTGAVNGYLYTFCGITTCFVTGYIISWLTPASKVDISELTVFKRH